MVNMPPKYSNRKRTGPIAFFFKRFGVYFFLAVIYGLEIAFAIANKEPLIDLLVLKTLRQECIPVLQFAVDFVKSILTQPIFK
jgi:hypothetical protein